MFIDRDGDKFSHVLNYLRYGSIELPATVPQAMFQRELDYYSIEAADGTITQTKTRSLCELMNNTTEENKIVSQKEMCMSLAMVCFTRFQNHFRKCYSSNFDFYLDRSIDGDDALDFRKHQITPDDKKIWMSILIMSVLPWTFQEITLVKISLGFLLIRRHLDWEQLVHTRIWKDKLLPPDATENRSIKWRVKISIYYLSITPFARELHNI